MTMETFVRRVGLGKVGSERSSVCVCARVLSLSFTITLDAFEPAGRIPSDQRLRPKAFNRWKGHRKEGEDQKPQK